MQNDITGIAMLLSRGNIHLGISSVFIEGHSLLWEHPEKKKWLEEVYKMSCVDSSCLLVLNMVLLAGRRGEHLHHRGKKATF